MRIISGKYRGMKLAGFKGEEIRPTADRVKESLFSIISARVAGARVLDLFCGSGNLGIECLSRGSAFVQFNDLSKDSVAVLKKNLAKLKDGDWGVSIADFSHFLSCTADKYDIIFIDPPYKSEAGMQALEIIANRRLLKPDGIAVYERDRAYLGDIKGVIAYDERKYGKTYLTFFKESL